MAGSGEVSEPAILFALGEIVLTGYVFVWWPILAARATLTFR